MRRRCGDRCGWPWGCGRGPTRTPLNAVVHGAVARDGYTVERVFFESVPGHFVTGSLYRPTGAQRQAARRCSRRTGTGPADDFRTSPRAEREQQLASGAERFDNAARHILQARAVQLARMGAVVFLYDMVGYADSVQIPQEIAAQRRAAARVQVPTTGCSSASAPNCSSTRFSACRSGTPSARWISSARLPDVDPARIAVTGASGGGTQTFLLSAIDDRPAVAFPAVMVSARMQGGCTCENADYLRIGTGNVELAALFAPKPLGMTAADDWTKTMPTDGFPELQKHYELFGARDKVQLFPFLQFGHNYNHVSRAAMYGWLNQHLGLGADEPVLERDFVPLSREEATVWTAAHPAPPRGEAARARGDGVVDAGYRAAAGGGFGRVMRRRWRAWRELLGGAVAGLIGPTSARRLRCHWCFGTGTPAGGSRRRDDDPARAAIRRASVSRPARAPAPGPDVVVWTSAGGARRQPPKPASPSPRCRRCSTRAGAWSSSTCSGRGRRVRTTGSWRIARRRPTPSATTRRWWCSARTTRWPRFGTLARWPASTGRVTLVALDGQSTAWAALARAHAGALVDAAAFATDGFRFGSVTSLEDAAFLPGGAKYGDLPAVLTLAAPQPLWLAGETPESIALLKDAYRAAAAPKALTGVKGLGRPRGCGMPSRG